MRGKDQVRTTKAGVSSCTRILALDPAFPDIFPHGQAEKT